MAETWAAYLPDFRSASMAIDPVSAIRRAWRLGQWQKLLLPIVRGAACVRFRAEASGDCWATARACLLHGGGHNMGIMLHLLQRPECLSTLSLQPLVQMWFIIL